jgi:membrane carboxypeptidase/penicillin-binding protein PbpC
VFHHLHNTIVLGKITIEINQQKELNKVEFYVDNKLKYIDYNQSYQWQWDSKDPGRHTIEIITYDGEGNTVEKEMTAWKFF